MTNDKRFSGDPLEIRDVDFDEWVSDAATDTLLDALYDFLTVLESESKLADKDADFTNPDNLFSLGMMTPGICQFAYRTSEIQRELYSRRAPIGHEQAYLERLFGASQEA
jgi:hypothetical protein